MYSYKMWNMTFDEVENNRDLPFGFEPMTFHETKRGNVQSFNIEELDALTSLYRNNESFCQKLEEYKGKYIFGNRHIITITHEANGNFYQDEPIYDDKMVYDTAQIIRQKKREKRGSSIGNYNKVNEFIEYIKDLAVNDESYLYIIEPEKLVGKISDDDIYALRSYIKDDSYNRSGKIVEKNLRSLLYEYRVYSKAKEQCLNNGESFELIQNDLDIISKKISKNIKDNYRVFRNLVVWENKYLEVLEKQIKNVSSKEKLGSLSVLIEEIKLQKNYRNDRIPKSQVAEFYDNKEEIRESAELNYRENNNDTDDELMNFYFNEGGIDEVMKNVSIDDIYGNKNTYNTAVKLGVVSKRK